MINLDIEIDRRNNGKFFNKNKGIRSNKEIRDIAIKDMSEETGEGKFFNRPYLGVESRVLSTCDVVLEVFSINTCIL